MVERPADNRAQLQSAPGVLFKPVYPRSEQGKQVLGDGYLVDVGIRPPARAGLIARDNPGVDERADELFDEEGVAVGLFQDRPAKLGRHFRKTEEIFE